MKGKSTLNFVPWSKIHQPLPRTPRQSQQLLNALTSSFRRQLDQEHPSSIPSSERDGHGSPPPENPNSSVHATDKHLRNILDNPLFRVTPPKPKHTNVYPPVEGTRIFTEPMVVFDELAASGSVTKRAFQFCLQSQLSLLASRHTGSALVEAMKESHTGSKIKNWWFASDQRTKNILLKFKQSAVPRTAVKFMVAEGLQDVVLVWLDLAAKRGLEGDDTFLKAQSQKLYKSLLDELICFELEHGGGLPAALQHYLQVIKRSSDISNTPIDFRYQSLYSAAKMLHCSVLEQQDKPVPAAAFDEFLKVASAVFPHAMLCYSLPLYHPTQANPTPFLKYLDGFTVDRLGHWSTPARANLIQVGLDALRILAAQDRSQDKSVVERFLQQVMPVIKDQEARQMDREWSSGEERLVARLGTTLGLTLT